MLPRPGSFSQLSIGYDRDKWQARKQPSQPDWPGALRRLTADRLSGSISGARKAPRISARDLAARVGYS
jgi:hypothetical protein